LLPQCVECGLFQSNVNSKNHLESEDCKRYAEIKRNRRTDLKQQSAKNVSFSINGIAIKKVKSFKYLGRMLTETDDDLEAVELQLKKARMTWGRMCKILQKKTNGNPRIMSIFYKTIIQSVLLYGSESWVLTKIASRKLQSFHRRCARFITGRHIKLVDDKWIYPCTKKTMEMADLLPIEEYIKKRKDTIRIFAEEREILAKCKSSSILTRNNRSLAWWDEKRNIEENIMNITEISNSESNM
jgi:hypothetical protein